MSSTSKPSAKHALVTGASRGIGRGIALELAKAGYRVAINYAGNSAAADETLAQIRALGSDGFTVQGDVSVAADRARLVAETVKNFGRIDLLVNNAGVAPTVRADILEAGEESFDRLYSINLKGPYFLTQLVANQMLKQERDSEGFRGRIVTTTSISVYTASTSRGDYCIVKAGLAMMTKLYADRLANDGINVYEVRPGIIATDMTGAVKEKYDKLILQDGITPIRRWGTPEDIGRAVRAIAEDRFPFSTGAVFDVDGGFHLQRL
ncbi:3-ketoacyl-ACP reductase [Opitutaceae bacterium TAV4]|uniref:3-ketoacyl-ACP reductase n=1 Tax=Geminisphaera colitermitum TaxID=1148786 RepID=UPI000158C9E9|nr:3-ketoacyl-ACP reductase [Geminisphaera colitermitum]RRJ97018.1 3-ketoacyl-ACP reductase [Opitutaceae bacterium TAV4]RRJ98063.1 3-ketoacyl-ACP reductase [Opitutaceae bacterium TAV4]RRK02651.1 3-ketoacyl-ACP reductase [Opitutaceae bacterium TAV3]